MSTRKIGLWTLAVVGGIGLWLWFRRAPEPAPTQASTQSGSVRLPGPLAGFGGDKAPERPRTPPVRGRDEPPVADEPEMPADVAALRLAAYQEAVAQHEPRPGEQAFRAMVAAFIEHNQAFAEAQAKAENIAVDEVEELTFFGLMAQESQRWGEVEQMLGTEVGPAERARSQALLRELDNEFEQSMRALVADGGTKEDRWALIRSVQSEYRERYFDITGMNEALLDALLAGDASRDYAPGSTPPLEDMPPNEASPEPTEPRQNGPGPKR